MTDTSLAKKALYVGGIVGSTFVLTKTFIVLSPSTVNVLAQALIEQYDKAIKTLTLPIAEIIKLMNELFRVNIAPPPGWRDTFAVIFLKPASDSVIDAERVERPFLSNRRAWTCLFYLVLGIMVALPFSFLSAQVANPKVSFLPVLFVTLAVTIYEIIKSLYVGNMHIPKSVEKRFGLSAKSSNVRYYIIYYAGGFFIIGVIASIAAWMCTLIKIPAPSAVGSIIYLALMAFYHLWLAFQARKNDTRDYREDFREIAFISIRETARYRWSKRVSQILFASLVAACAAFLHID